MAADHSDRAGGVKAGAFDLSAVGAALAEGENSGPPEAFDVERFLLERRAAE